MHVPLLPRGARLALLVTAGLLALAPLGVVPRPATAVPTTTATTATTATTGPAISAGNDHSCGIDSRGGVKCWGSGADGRLGNGDSVSEASPVQVRGLLTGATSVSAGEKHTCAAVSGRAWCWGSNASGRLGIDTATTGADHPVEVQGLVGTVTAVSVGWYDSCAIVDGGAWCWGEGSVGRLGNGADASTSTPVQVQGLESGVTSLSAGYAHTCAVAHGAAYCWGWNSSGQLGDGTHDDSWVPRQVQGLTSGVTSISAGGEHTCAVVRGAARCWGRNNEGRLGNGQTTESAVPVQVTGLTSRVTAVNSGAQDSCAIARGAATCWGLNDQGQLGTGSVESASSPVAVVGLGSGVTAIDAGYKHGCAVVSGEARCWGAGGRTGDGSNDPSPAPVPVVRPLIGATSIDAGGPHACAVVAGVPSCWGANSSGQLGDGTTSWSRKPVRASGITSGATAVSTGDTHTCAVVAGGVECWGEGSLGRLGTGTESSSSTPVEVSGIGPGSGTTLVAAGRFHSCALVAGQVKCWGYNNGYALGDGTTVDSFTPVNVSGLDASSGVTALSAGWYHSCAVVAGKVKCWGNMGGQVPTAIAGVTEATAVGSGTNFACALVSGGVKCWGSNPYGQLGSPAQDPAIFNPAQTVTGLPGAVTAISVGDDHACAVVQGAAKCWGRNNDGQLGDGTTTDSHVPVQVAGLTEGVTAIAAGSIQSCAVVYGEVRCWGSNSSATIRGELGFAPLHVVPPTPVVTAAPASVKLGKAIGLKVSCPEGCALALTLKVGARSIPGLTAVEVEPGVEDVTVVLPQQVLAQVRKARTESARPTTSLTILPTGDSGAGTARTVVIDVPTPVPAITSAPKAVRLGKAIGLKVSCPDGCRLVPGLRVGGKNIPGVKAVTVKAGAKAVTIKLPKKVVAQVTKARKRSPGAKTALTITPRVGAVAGATRKVSIR